MTNWSNYAWRLRHWLWHHLFCWSVKKQTYSIIHWGAQSHSCTETDTHITPDAKHVQGHRTILFWGVNTDAHTDMPLAGATIWQHDRSTEGQWRSAIFHPVDAGGGFPILLTTSHPPLLDLKLEYILMMSCLKEIEIIADKTCLLWLHFPHRSQVLA